MRHLVICLGLGAVLAACSKGGLGLGSAQLQTSKFLTVEDLGVPYGGLVDPKAPLEPMLREDGVPLVAEAQKTSKVVTNVEQEEVVELPKGNRVAIVARNGEWFRISGKVTTSDGESLIEGFARISDLKYLGPANEGHEIDLTPVRANKTRGADGQSDSDILAEVSSEASKADSDDQDNENHETTGQKPVRKTLGSVRDGQHDVAEGSCLGVKFKAPRGGFTCDTTRDVLELRRDSSLLDGFYGCMVPGEILRKRGDDRTYFEVSGQAAKIRVTPSADAYKCNETCRASADDVYASKVVDAQPGAGTHRIPLHEILTQENKLVGGTRTFGFETLNDQGSATGYCELHMIVVSPIVLDLAAKGSFNGTNLGESDVRFDVLGKGHAVQTGWVAPSMGFLALDLNRDGVINSGAELFGEGTRKADGSTFSNGYVALAAHDTNADGVVDAKDPVFKRLVVWQDLNTDGQSSKDELRPLGAHGITSISVVYGPSFRHGAPVLGQNDVRYEARFFGPQQCGQEGCLSFDVFFATASSVAGR